MDILYFMFNQTIQLSFMATVTLIIILCIRRITKNRLGIKFQYLIWFILILRIIPCINLPSKISLYNYLPSYKTTVINIPTYLDKIEINTTKIDNVDTSIAIHNESMNIANILAVIWIIVFCSITIIMIISTVKVTRQIRNSQIINDEEIISLFNECKSKLNVNINIKLIKTDIVNSPCICGIIKPKILVPQLILENKHKFDLKYVFLHELGHVKRGDILVNYLIYFISTLHWFNPFIYYGLNKMKEDMEIACDSLVLSCLDTDENIKYGNLLINLLEISSRAPWLPQMAGIINNKNKIKRRIKMIKRFKKNSYRLSIIAIAGLILVGGTLLTEANTLKTNATPIKQDKIDYPFVNDEKVIGKWEAVDFVEEIGDFNVGEKDWGQELYLKDIIVLPDGKMAQPITSDTESDEVTPVSWFTWTNGYFIHHGDKTAEKYTIKEIDGEKYMFLEWKSGDYTIRGMKPYYYVLKQVK